jgi:prepilin-type N-terminal cleavage/methylation domain-containing protein
VIGKSLGQVKAFTLVELLVVIAIIGILAAILLPVLNKAKIRAQGVQCVNNLKQMSLGWQIYADENDSHCPINGSTTPGGKAPVGEDMLNPSWVAGVLSTLASSDNTNIDFLTGSAYQRFGSIGTYIKNPNAYHCPGDVSLDPGSHSLRTRSISMNSWMNPGRTNSAAIYWSENFEKFTQLSNFRGISPANTFVFIDESANTINDGWLLLNMDGYKADGTIDENLLDLYDVPAAYHNLCGSLSYADGHVELHRWQGGVTLDDDDIVWLITHATVPTKN